MAQPLRSLHFLPHDFLILF